MVLDIVEEQHTMDAVWHPTHERVALRLTPCGLEFLLISRRVILLAIAELVHGIYVDTLGLDFGPHLKLCVAESLLTSILLDAVQSVKCRFSHTTTIAHFPEKSRPIPPGLPTLREFPQSFGMRSLADHGCRRGPS